MNILFLSVISNIVPSSDGNIYSSVLYELTKNNHVYIVSPSERREKQNTSVTEGNNYTLLKVKTGNITKCNLVEKGVSSLLIQSQYKRAINKYFNNVKFDLILYATPPITFCSTIKYFKNRDGARTYLMLKDIFPQTAVDLKVFSKNSIFYYFFRKKEIELYNISDTIGCMSTKNVEYLLEHNSYLDSNKVEVFPNTINPKKENIRSMDLNNKYREKYNIPKESKVFMYGGNLGRPQGIPFIIECLKEVKNLDNAFFVICGSGTEYKRLEEFKENNKDMHNFLLLNGLPKQEYDEFLNIADVGLIFLDYNFTIPNFPQRILSYMEKGIPVLSCTDPNTDIGDIIEENNFGWKCYSNDSKIFKKTIDSIVECNNIDLRDIGINGINYLDKYYRSDIVIDLLLSKRR